MIPDWLATSDPEKRKKIAFRNQTDMWTYEEYLKIVADRAAKNATETSVTKP